MVMLRTGITKLYPITRVETDKHGKIHSVYPTSDFVRIWPLIPIFLFEVTKYLCFKQFINRRTNLWIFLNLFFYHQINPSKLFFIRPPRIKFSSKTVNVFKLMVYGGVEAILHAFVSSELDGNVWSESQSNRFYLRRQTMVDIGF